MASSDGAAGALERAGLALSAALPAWAAIRHLPLADHGGNDVALVRALGFESVGLPSIDAFAGAPFLLLPLGTLVFRLSLASAFAAGAAGAAIYLLGLSLLGTAGFGRSTDAARVDRFHQSLPPIFAALGSLGATLSVPWQREAAIPLGSTISAALLLGALAYAIHVLRVDGVSRAFRAFLPIGCAALAAVVFFAIRRYAGAGAMPELDVASGPLLEGERARGYVSLYLGTVTGILAAAGAALTAFLAIRAWRNRALTAALPALFVAAAASMLALGLGAGPERFGAAVLAAHAVLSVFAVACVAHLTRWVASLAVPLASASAAMVVLLAVTFPVVAFDESELAREAGAPLEDVDWQALALGRLPEGAAIVLEDPVVARRLAASRLAGEAPESIVVVPLHDIGGRAMRRALAEAPALVGLVRDVTLTGRPTELAMSKLAEERPLAVAFSPRWERALARHLLPAGLFDRFEPEPRGLLERRKLIDASDREILALAEHLGMVGDRALAGATARLLFARANALGATRDREATAKVAAQLEALEPGGAMAREILDRFAPPPRDLARR